MKLIDPGRSPRGWSSFDPIGVCEQRYAYGKVLGLEERVFSPAPALGSLLHTGAAHLAVHAAGQTIVDGVMTRALDVLPPYEAIEAHAEQGDRERFDQGLGRAWTLLVGQAHQMLDALVNTRPFDYVDVLAVETVHGGVLSGPRWMPVPPGASPTVSTRYSARLDIVTGHPKGIDPSKQCISFDDYKTASYVDDRKRWGYAMSGQLLGHTWFGHKLFGPRFAGVNLVFVGSTNFKVTREQLSPSPDSLAKWPRAILDRVERLEMLEASGRDPWDWPRAMSEQVCIGRYGACPYLDLCRYGKPT